ncbi:hypothetical protein ACFBZI_00900 [Moraxella sp. ZJ142]|uniref:hypothetical protein n=1 Tax=Moraxella marmotae TaxID=3344520 RepID=UPI0035D4C152
MKQTTQQSGFVLLIVLVMILFIALMTTWLITQNTTDQTTAYVYERQQSLLMRADADAMAVWQISPVQLNKLANDKGSWLNTAITTAHKEQGIAALGFCENMSQMTVGTSDTQTDSHLRDCPPSAMMIRHWLYAVLLDDSHYLTKQVAAPIPHHTDSMPNAEPAAPQATWQYYHLLLYTVAHRPTLTQNLCQNQSMYQHQAAKCLANLGIAASTVAVEWLAAVPLIGEQEHTANQDNQDNWSNQGNQDNAINQPKSSPSIQIVPLRIYDVRPVASW